MCDDRDIDAAVEHMEKLAHMNARFTHKRKREILEAMDYDP